MQFECRHKAWPAHLGQLMEQDVVNIAQAGSGNERISRTTMDWIIRNVQLNKTYSPDDVTVIIMWSGFNRFETWHDGIREFVSSQADEFYSDKYPELTEYAKLRTFLNTWASDEYKNLIMVFNLAIFLEHMGIKYYFLNGVHSWSPRSAYIKTGMAVEFDTMYRGYGDKRIERHLAFGDPQQLPAYQLKDIPYAPHARWPHWDERGHKAWARIVHNWITSLK